MIPTQSHYIPDSWKKNDPYSIARWMGSLPIVRDIAAAERADERYTLLKILNEIKK